jgi:hypothetical protein
MDFCKPDKRSPSGEEDCLTGELSDSHLVSQGNQLTSRCDGY